MYRKMCFWATCLFVLPTASNAMLAFRFDGHVLDFNPITGAFLDLGASGVTEFNASAVAPDGTIYAATFSSDKLYKIDPGNGAATFVANLTIDCRAMAFRGSTLYAIGDASPDRLYTINPATGAATLVGATGLSRIQALACFSSGSALYGYEVTSGASVGAGLVTINTATGAATDVNAAVPGTDIQGLEFTRSGTLYGARDQLFVFNTATGVETPVGPGGMGDVRGLAELRENVGIIAIDFAGGVHRINENTGTSVSVGPSGYPTANSLTSVGSPFRLYTEAGGDLVQIDPGTGAGTTLTALSQSGIRALAYSGGVLYAVVNATPFDNLYRVNPVTGACALVGSMGFSGVQGMTSSPGGTLYAWDIVSGLLTVNAATGAATDVSAVNGGTGDIQTIEFSPDGLLYGCRDALYSINGVTGAYAVIGAGSYTDVRGISFTGVRVVGRVNLGQLVPDEAGRVVQITLRHPGVATPLESHAVTLGTSGDYSFATILGPGTFDIAAKGTHWLRAIRSNVTITSGGAISVNFLLANGDVDGDNEVTLADYGRLAAAFGSVPGDPTWDEEADLDGDLEVTLADYSILALHFGEVGDD